MHDVCIVVALTNVAIKSVASSDVLVVRVHSWCPVCACQAADGKGGFIVARGGLDSAQPFISRRTQPRPARDDAAALLLSLSQSAGPDRSTPAPDVSTLHVPSIHNY